MSKVIIIGGKGCAVSIAELMDDARSRFGMDIEVLGFAFDDEQYKDGINGWPVLCGTREAYDKYKDDEDVYFVYALYNINILEERNKLRDSLGIPKERYITFVHPSSYVAKSAALGHGCIIAAQCVIDNNAVLGDFNMLRSTVHIGHDTITGIGNYYAPYTVVGALITIGHHNFFGIGSNVRSLRKIGDNSFIAQGANVVKDVDSNQIAIGNPAQNKAR